MIDWITYLHIFFLFPCMFYIIIIAVNGTGKSFNYNVRVLMAFLAVVVLLGHCADANLWLKPTKLFFAPIQTANVVTVYSTLSLNSKIIVAFLACISIFIFYNIL